MSIWLVVTLFGQVAQVTGPLPYDKARCAKLATEQASMLDQRFEADAYIKAPPAKLAGKIVTRTDVVVECRSADDRPKIEISMAG